MARDRLLPALREGRGDFVAANLTVTPERAKQVDFTVAYRRGREGARGHGAGAPRDHQPRRPLGQGGVRPALQQLCRPPRELNARFKKEGSAPVTIVPADENLETEDILEMVGAGPLPRHRRRPLSRPLLVPGLHRPKRGAGDGIQRGRDASPGRSARTAPKLHTQAQRLLKTHQVGTREGNVLVNKYLKSTRWVKNARSKESIERFRAVAELLPEVQQAVRLRLAADDRAGLPGVAARPEPQEPRSARSGSCRSCPPPRSDRNVNIPRHHDRGEQHPRRRQVHALHRQPVLRGRAHGPG